MIKVNSYDIDGVVYMGEYHTGLIPGPQDIIVTGRSYQDRPHTLAWLRERGIHNMVFFNPTGRHDPDYSARVSALHKAMVFKKLFEIGIHVDIHFEDSDEQIEVILSHVEGLKTKVVKIGTGEWLHA